jgi:hypothetical protein
MKPITPEGSLSINKKLDDSVNIINVNSLDNRMQIIGKGTSANSLIVIPNADGTTVGIQLSSDFQKCFILPLASKSNETGFITATSSSSFAFVNDGVLAQTDITRGITLHSTTNGGKRHFVDSNGLLATVANNTTIRQNWIYNRANTPPQWELAGLLFEPPSRNVINPSWTGLNTGIFGVTGATTGVTTGYQSGYWNTNSIPGMTVYSLTEETTGPNLQNTVWIPPTGISLGSLSPNNTTAGISWSAFMLSGFFKSGGTVGGITKDIVQLWLATNPSGTVKKGIYFNLSTCSTVATSSGGTTLAFYFTEPMANGWCRCGAGVGFAGQTWPSSEQIEQFGFSTARPDGSGGYTFGGLLGTSAGSVYFSGLGVDVLATESLATNIYSNRLGPVQYIPPSSSTQLAGDIVVYTVKGHPNYLFPSGLTNGALNYSAFHEGLINAPVGISGEELGFGSSCWSVQLSTDTSLTTTSGNNTILAHIITSRGQQTTDITPSPAINSYWQIASQGGTFSNVFNTHNRRLSVYHNKPGIFGFTAGHAFRVAFSGVSGALKYFFNGQTGINYGLTGILWNQPINNGSTGVVMFIQAGARDKKVHHKNIVFYPQTNFTDDQGKALTSFPQQARAAFIGAGGAGGYNENTAQFIDIGLNQSQTDDTSPIPRPGNYEIPTILVP